MPRGSPYEPRPPSLPRPPSRAYARRESAPSRTLSLTPDRRHCRTFGTVQRGGRVPVTARLSKRFYDVFGEEIANELVNWFNQVDESYRTDLREVNELNFARFDGKLEQRLAESDAKWERRFAESDTKWERRIAELRVEIQKA